MSGTLAGLTFLPAVVVGIVNGVPTMRFRRRGYRVRSSRRRPIRRRRGLVRRIGYRM